MQINVKKITQNKKAYQKYFIEKKIEAGIVLLGWEVKSARNNMVNISNNYIKLKNQEILLYNTTFQTNISDNKNVYYDYNPNRIRKLLLHKYEILSLKNKINRQGFTLTILELFWKKSWIKAHIGLVKGKKMYDKRHEINKKKWLNEKNKFYNI